MKKVIQLFAVISVLILAAVILTACGGESADINVQSGTNASVYSPAPSPMPQQELEPHNEWTIEELGEKIVAAGTFWEDWWNMRGRFDWQHFEQFEFEWEPLPEHYVTSSPEHTAWLERQDALHKEYMARFPEHLAERGMGMGILLSTSGFEGINDIRNYLLQYYTQEWVDAELFRDFSVFVEYDGVLFVDGTRAGFARPNWETAEHSLIEQDGNRAVVETTFLHGSWHRGYEYAYPVKATYRFTFIDGKIDIGLGPWAHSENMVFEALPFTVSQLGRIIESEGHFWESWWNYRASLDWWFNHIDWYEMFQTVEYPEHNVYLRVLPSSGFESIDCIRDSLSWNNTENRINQLLSGEAPPFKEFDGMLYINITRPIIPRPDWSTAAHILVEQYEHHALVETTVDMVYAAEYEGQYPVTREVQFRFTFIDGKIDTGPGVLIYE